MEPQKMNSDEDDAGAARRLTVRLLIPSENAPICLTVPSESSICQRTSNQRSGDADQVESSIKKKKDKKKGVCMYLLQVVQVLLVDPDPPPLEAAALRHFHVHGADVLLAVVLTFLPQRAETAE